MKLFLQMGMAVPQHARLSRDGPARVCHQVVSVHVGMVSSLEQRFAMTITSIVLTVVLILPVSKKQAGYAVVPLQLAFQPVGMASLSEARNVKTMTIRMETVAQPPVRLKLAMSVTQQSQSPLVRFTKKQFAEMGS